MKVISPGPSKYPGFSPYLRFAASTVLLYHPEEPLVAGAPHMVKKAAQVKKATEEGGEEERRTQQHKADGVFRTQQHGRLPALHEFHPTHGFCAAHLDFFLLADFD